MNYINNEMDNIDVFPSPYGEVGFDQRKGEFLK